YLTIARDELFDKGMMGSARWLTQMVAMDKLPKSRAGESLDILKTMASEKIDNAYPAPNQKPGQSEISPEMLQAFEPLMTKVFSKVDVAPDSKTGPDPKKTIIDYLKEMTDLQGDELKLRDKLLVSPSLVKAADAAKLPTVKERMVVYRDLLAPILKADTTTDPQMAKLKKDVEDTLAAVEQKSQDGAPGLESLILSQLFIQVDLSGAEQKKMEVLAKAAEAHDKDAAAAQSLMDKASLLATSNPDENAFGILKLLKEEDLSADEKKIRTQLLEDKVVEKYIGMVGEASMDKRLEKYATALKEGDLAKSGYGKSQTWLGSMIQSGKIPDAANYFPPLQPGQPKPEAQENAEKLDSNVRKFLALTEGKGGFGTKFEFGLKHFTKEVAKPTTLAAMTVAPFAGAGCELFGLWKFKNWGTAGRLIATGMGVTGEAAAFTYSSKALDSYFYSSEGLWENHTKDLKSNILLFGSMRAAHYGSAAFAERFLATGRMGKWAGGYVAGEAGASGMAKTPGGQVFNVGKAAGPGVPQLTVAGKRLAGVLDHSVAVGAMYGSGKASNKLGWTPQAATFSDTLLMYMQAMAGFKLADAATMGKLGTGMAVMRMRADNAKAGKAPDPTPVKATPADMLRLFDRKVHDVTLEKADGGETLPLVLPKVGKKVSLDAFLLDGEGKGLSLSRDKDGNLVLHNKQKAVEAPLPEEAKAAEPKQEEVKVDGAGEEKKDEAKKDGTADPKAAEPKVEAKAEEKPEEKTDDSKAAEPAKPPVEILVNGKSVEPGKSAKVGDEDVITVGGKEIRVKTPSEVTKALADVSREEQLSLARAIAKVKDPGALFRMLKDSPYQGAVDILMALGEVFSGKRPLEKLPEEMGIRAKVKTLLEGQVADMNKAGLVLDPGMKLKDGAVPKDFSPLETEFHTLKAMEALKLRLASARNIPEVLEILGESSFEEVGGVKVKDIFDWLGYEQLKAVVEQARKSESALTEKITIGEKRLKLETEKKKKDAPLIAELEGKLEDWKERAQQSKDLYTVLEKALEAQAKDPADKSSADADFAQLVDKLPPDFGIRQKARDGYEQSKGDFAKSLNEKERKSAVDLVKKYVDIHATEDFDAAQRSLRQAIDSASPQARMMLRRAKPAELELILKLYFGEAKSRELQPAQAYQVAVAFGQAKVSESLGLVQSLEGTGPFKLVRGDLDAVAKSADGEAVILRTHSSTSDGQHFTFTSNEILGLVEQSKRVSKAEKNRPADAKPYQGSPENPLKGQLSDTQAYFDPETNTFQTWVVHGRGLSKIRITLDEKGEVESYEIKHATKPGEGEAASLLTPPKLEQLIGAGGKVIPVEGKSVDYAELLKEFPFDVPGVTRAEKVFDKVAKVTDRIPSLPKFPKFGKDAKKVDAKPAEVKKPDENKTDPQDPKDPPTGGQGAPKVDSKDKAEGGEAAATEKVFGCSEVSSAPSDDVRFAGSGIPSRSKRRRRLTTP
ncbi:MAG: hypothetical protein K8R69_02205, partial [Deltaproteobacteria bacterium]|nr:hypothetical protein [Deltaproteobacteria bacterium]